MAAKVVSIELGQILTRICEISISGKNVKVLKSVVVETPPNLVMDGIPDTGEQVLAGHIKHALAVNKIKTKKVVFSINSNKIAIRDARIPVVKEKRIFDVVQAKADECFPVDLSDYKITYSILGTVTDEKGNSNYKILLLAAPLLILQTYYDLAKQCGLEVAGIDYMGNSLYQAAKKSCKEGTQLIAKLDEQSSLLMVVKNGELFSLRSMGYSVNEIINDYIEENDSGNLSYLRAVNILQTDQYEFENFLVGGDSSNTENRRDALESLINGISRVVDFYNSQHKESPVDSICITGLGGSFCGFGELVEQQLGIPTHTLKEAEGISLPKNGEVSALGNYISCVGSAIQPLDFLLKGGKAEQKKEKEKGDQTQKQSSGALGILLFVGGVAVAAVMAVMALMSYKEALDEKNRLARRLEELKPAEVVYNNYLLAEGLWIDAKTMNQLTQNHNDDLVKFIQELEEKMPADIVVLSMTASADNVVLNIDVSSKESAAKVIQELRTFESIDIVNNTGLSDTVDENDQHLVSFSVSCTYREEQE